MDLLLSGLIITFFEGIIAWGVIFKPFKTKRYTWVALGKFCMFLFIAADLLWIDSPCKGGMTCKHTAYQHIIYYLTVAILYLISLTLKENHAKIALNAFCSSVPLMTYIAFNDFCEKPDMRCITYTKPHILLYAILLIIFMFIETVVLVLKEGNDKKNEFIDIDCKESSK